MSRQLLLPFPAAVTIIKLKVGQYDDEDLLGLTTRFETPHFHKTTSHQLPAIVLLTLLPTCLNLGCLQRICSPLQLPHRHELFLIRRPPLNSKALNPQHWKNCVVFDESSSSTIQGPA